MILRLKVRSVPRRKRSGSMTGVIYLHKYALAGRSVIVMDREHYMSLRRQIVLAHKKLDKIKRFAGSLKFKPVIK